MLLVFRITNANRQIERCVEVMGRIQLFDRNSILGSSGVGAAIEDRLQQTNGWLQPEIDLLPIELGFNVFALRFGIVQQVVLKLGKINGERFRPAYKRLKCL